MPTDFGHSVVNGFRNFEFNFPTHEESFKTLAPQKYLHTTIVHYKIVTFFISNSITEKNHSQLFCIPFCRYYVGISMTNSSFTSLELSGHREQQFYITRRMPKFSIKNKIFRRNFILVEKNLRTFSDRQFSEKSKMPEKSFFRENRKI